MGVLKIRHFFKMTHITDIGQWCRLKITPLQTLLFSTIWILPIINKFRVESDTDTNSIFTCYLLPYLYVQHLTSTPPNGVFRILLYTRVIITGLTLQNSIIVTLFPILKLRKEMRNVSKRQQKKKKKDVVWLPMRQLSTRDQNDTDINNYRSP